MNNSWTLDYKTHFYTKVVSIYSIALPIMICLCLLAFILNALILISARSIKRRQMFNATLRLTYSLSAADMWSSLILMSNYLLNSYLPNVLQVPQFHKR